MDLPRASHPRGDPRDVFPVLVEAGVITDERVERWQLKHECLCGCGKETKPLHGRPEDNEYSFFTLSCWTIVAQAHGIIRVSLQKDQRWREGILRENADRLVSHDDSRWYVGMIRADIDDRGLNTSAWAQEKGLPRDSVYSWMKRVERGHQLSKYTVGVILTALGEKLPADIQRRYDVARQRRRKPIARRQRKVRH